MNKALVWILQLGAAGILLPVAFAKLTAGPNDVRLFTDLGMEPHGRIIIGVIEMIAGLLLLSPYAAIGALLSVGVMIGALIGHATVLGFIVYDDGGKHVILLGIELLTAGTVLLLRRNEIPGFGKVL